MKSGALISKYHCCRQLARWSCQRGHLSSNRLSQPSRQLNFHWFSQQSPSCCCLNRNSPGLTAHSADYALLMGLLRSSWWLILGLFLHFTHLLASMLPPIVAVTLVVQSQAGYWLSFSAVCTSASLPVPLTRLLSSLSVLFPIIPRTPSWCVHRSILLLM